MNTKFAFCFTLGHNSSCAVVDKTTGVVIAAYEEERLTRIKSDKNFAKQSFLKCLEAAEAEISLPSTLWKQNNISSEIYVSHWYDNFEFYKNRDAIKHERYDYDFFDNVVKNLINCEKIYYLSNDITHHDAHAYGALAFYSSHKSAADSNVGHILVVDGFGNNQEVVSVYKFNLNNEAANKPVEKIVSIRGYQYSLGLMYEFATEFMGMKPHEDEYKALGYESKIDTINLKMREIIIIDAIANQFANCITNQMIKSTTNQNKTHYHPSDVYININEFEQARSMFFAIFKDLLCDVEYYKKYTDDNVFEKRVIISYFIQTVLENVVDRLVYEFCDKFDTTLLVAGGVGYNVKMNNSLMKAINPPMRKNKFSVYPLAGDQGAGLGFYHAINKNLNLKAKGLCFGKRDLTITDEYFESTNKHFYEKYNEKFPFTVAYDYNGFIKTVINKLLHDEIVQIIHGDMEFGPRALLSNSTLAIPTAENVDIINAINGRNTVMPFAPLVSQEGVEYLFENNYEKVVGSLKYMILTLDYKQTLVSDENFMKLHKGVMHRYPNTFHDSKGREYYKYSGRPQVIDKESFMYPILKELEKRGIYALIQTSFNVHGRPITYSIDHVVSDFDFQLANKKKLGIAKPINVIVCNFK